MMDSATSTYEQKLLLKLREGDERALNKIFESYYDFLFISAYRNCGDQDESEDLVQEVFIRLWKKREHLHIESSLLSYLHQSIKNAFIDSQRKKDTSSKYRRDLLSYANTWSEQPDELLIQKELVSKIERLASKLPVKMGQAFLLNHFQQLTEAEIAKVLNVSEKTVKNLLSEASKNIRFKLGLAALLFFLLS